MAKTVNRQFKRKALDSDATEMITIISQVGDIGKDMDGKTYTLSSMSRNGWTEMGNPYANLDLGNITDADGNVIGGKKQAQPNSGKKVNLLGNIPTKPLDHVIDKKETTNAVDIELLSQVDYPKRDYKEPKKVNTFYKELLDRTKLDNPKAYTINLTIESNYDLAKVKGLLEFLTLKDGEKKEILEELIVSGIGETTTLDSFEEV